MQTCSLIVCCVFMRWSERAWKWWIVAFSFDSQQHNWISTSKLNETNTSGHSKIQYRVIWGIWVRFAKLTNGMCSFKEIQLASHRAFVLSICFGVRLINYHNFSLPPLALLFYCHYIFSSLPFAISEERKNYFHSNSCITYTHTPSILELGVWNLICWNVRLILLLRLIVRSISRE